MHECEDSAVLRGSESTPLGLVTFDELSFSVNTRLAAFSTSAFLPTVQVDVCGANHKGQAVGSRVEARLDEQDLMLLMLRAENIA